VTTLNLLCLPYSGASAMVYSRWRRKLPAWLQVRPVELPGRGARMAEPLQTDLQALARQLAGEQRLATAAPYALLGHSLGALLAFELAMSSRRWVAHHRWRSSPAAPRRPPGARATTARTGASPRAMRR